VIANPSDHMQPTRSIHGTTLPGFSIYRSKTAPLSVQLTRKALYTRRSILGISNSPAARCRTWKSITKNFRATLLTIQGSRLNGGTANTVKQNKMVGAPVGIAGVDRTRPVHCACREQLLQCGESDDCLSG